MNIKFKDYQITFEPLENLERPSYELERVLIKIHQEIPRAKSKTIKKIRKLIEEHPRNIQLRNYLVSAYRTLNKNKEALAANEEALQIKPDYLFGLLSQADMLIDEGELDKVPAILRDTDFDLNKMYPERDLFHISEFVSMQQIAVKYYAYTGDSPKAFERLTWLDEINPDVDTNDHLREIFLGITLHNMKKRMLDEHLQRITPIQKVKRTPFKRPEFSISLTQKLYEDRWELSSDFVEEYFQSNRDLLISDLEIVLKDSYSNFSPKNKKNGSAAFHAFFMLGELKAQKSLPILLEAFSQEGEYLDYVFDDYLTKHCWQAFFQVGKDNISDLFSYLKKPGLYTYGRSGVLDALPDLYIIYPETREQITQGYADLLNLFVQSDIKDNIIDSDLIGFLLSDLIALKLPQFLPQIKKLFEKEYVFDNHVGNYDEVEKRLLQNDEDQFHPKKIITVNEIYQSIRNYTKEQEEQENIAQAKEQINKMMIGRAKVNRNDTCPCGSGKKFKKCCLGKGIYD